MTASLPALFRVVAREPGRPSYSTVVIGRDSAFDRARSLTHSWAEVDVCDSTLAVVETLRRDHCHRCDATPVTVTCHGERLCAGCYEAHQPACVHAEQSGDPRVSFGT